MSSSDLLRPDDFSAMRWNIKEVPDNVAVMVKFPELYQIFQEYEKQSFEIPAMTTDQIVRYIIYVYHKRSPLVKKISDIFQRKYQALVYVGVRDFEKDYIKAFYTNENQHVVNAIMLFLKFEADMDYMALTMQTETYYNWNQAIASDSSKSADMKNNTTIFKTIRELREEIERLAEKVFHGDTNLVDFVAQQKVLSERKKITPEDNAKRR